MNAPEMPSSINAFAAQLKAIAHMRDALHQIPFSPDDHPELAATIWRQQHNFETAFKEVRARLTDATTAHIKSLNVWFDVELKNAAELAEQSAPRVPVSQPAPGKIAQWTDNRIDVGSKDAVSEADFGSLDQELEEALKQI